MRLDRGRLQVKLLRAQADAGDITLLFATRATR